MIYNQSGLGQWQSLSSQWLNIPLHAGGPSVHETIANNYNTHCNANLYLYMDCSYKALLHYN